MGLLRIILALSVFISHFGPLFGLKLMGGRVAVQTFFIISGFYMSLILSEKYLTDRSHRLFITNRFMRIYPSYLVLLALTVIYSIAAYHIPDRINFTNPSNGLNYVLHRASLSTGTLLYLIVSNCFIFGQDAALFLGLNPASGHLFFTPGFMKTSPRVVDFMLIPPAWTISLELMFYLIAPFVLRKSLRAISCLIALSFACRLLIYYGVGWMDRPWTEMFFPNEVGLFLLGAFSYRIYGYVKKRNTAGYALVLPGAFFLLLTLGYQFLPNFDFTKWCYYALATLCIPLLFTATRRSRVDRYIGELSYPLYLCHFLVGWMLRSFLAAQGLLAIAAPVILLASLLLSIALMETVIKPIDRFRQARLKASISR